MPTPNTLEIEGVFGGCLGWASLFSRHTCYRNDRCSIKNCVLRLVRRGKGRCDDPLHQVTGGGTQAAPISDAAPEAAPISDQAPAFLAPAFPAPDTVPGSGASSGPEGAVEPSAPSAGVGVVPGSGATPTPARPAPDAAPISDAAPGVVDAAPRPSDAQLAAEQEDFVNKGGTFIPTWGHGVPYPRGTKDEEGGHNNPLHGR